MTTHECVSDVQSSRLSPSLVCSRRKRRSQSIPAELAAPSASPYSERPSGCPRDPQEGAANKVTLNHNIITHGEEVKLSWRIEWRSSLQCSDLSTCELQVNSKNRTIIHRSTIKYQIQEETKSRAPATSVTIILIVDYLLS